MPYGPKNIGGGDRFRLILDILPTTVPYAAAVPLTIHGKTFRGPAGSQKSRDIPEVPFGFRQQSFSTSHTARIDP